MSTKTALKKAYKLLGKVFLSKELGISYQSMDRWHDLNSMPATEYNGKTKYAKKVLHNTLPLLFLL